MTSTTESLTPAPISQALAVTVAYMDYRYQITQQYGRHWTWTCNQVEWSQEGARFVYRCRVRVQIRRGCFAGRVADLQLDTQVDADTQEILGFSESGWDWRSHR